MRLGLRRGAGGPGQLVEELPHRGGVAAMGGDAGRDARGRVQAGPVDWVPRLDGELTEERPGRGGPDPGPSGGQGRARPGRPLTRRHRSPLGRLHLPGRHPGLDQDDAVTFLHGVHHPVEPVLTAPAAPA